MATTLLREHGYKLMTLINYYYIIAKLLLLLVTIWQSAHACSAWYMIAGYTYSQCQMRTYSVVPNSGLSTDKLPITASCIS